MFSCSNCLSNLSTVVYHQCKDYYLGKHFLVDYVRCQNCGLVQQSPMPTAKDLAAFYDSYPIHLSKPFFYRFLRSWVMRNVYFSPKDMEPGSILVDFGCGDGWFLETQKHREIFLIGFEPNVQYARALSDRLQLPVFSDLEKLTAEWEGRVDVVTLHFVLEHVPNLRTTISSLQRLLKPGGLLYFVVPQFNSFESRLFGRKWHGLDPPRHLSFPERGAVASLADMCELTVEKAQFVPFPNGFAGSIPVVLTGRFRFIFFLACLPLGIMFSWIFPQATQAFWLRKRGSQAVGAVSE